MTDAAQKIAERVPLPEPVVLAEHRFNWPEVSKVEGYTAAQMEALRLAVAAEALRGAEAVGEPNGKLVGWWNGIGGDGGSVRWGAERENEYHDIPLYDGYNPIHYKAPNPPAGSVEVTDAMVERAYQKFYSGGHTDTYEAWRAALTAALHGDKA